MAKYTQITLLTALIPLSANAHETSTSGSSLHALQHSALALGAVAALTLAIVGVLQIVRKVRHSR